MEDAELIRQAVAGDEQAFATLLDRHRRRVVSVVASVLGTEGRPMIEDIVQDVVVKTAAALASFRFESSFATWLYRLTFNVAVDARRSAGARHARERAYAETLADRHESASFDALHHAMDELPPVYRFVIHAHYWLGHTTPEIGTMLGVSPNTVKSYLFRARNMLADRMGKEKR
jgi:RNA polymerase sigma-70 factor (ECF subfamily)